MARQNAKSEPPCNVWTKGAVELRGVCLRLGAHIMFVPFWQKRKRKRDLLLIAAPIANTPTVGIGV